MTELVTGRPPKGDWKNKISPCSRRGNHLYKVKTKLIEKRLCTLLVCSECGFTAPTVKIGPMPPKRDLVVRRAKK